MTKPRPRRRALRWDGACLYRIPPSQGWADVTPHDVSLLRADARNRSPARPNPIGLHRATVVAVEDGRLRVHPLEAIDQTPLVDIKPVIRADRR